MSANGPRELIAKLEMIGRSFEYRAKNLGDEKVSGWNMADAITIKETIKTLEWVEGEIKDLREQVEKLKKSQRYGDDTPAA